MLILSRRIGETIVIDGTIRVMVVGVKGGAVRLGVQAPPEVVVDRQEIHDLRARPRSGVRPEAHLLGSR
jgi:carbon storage regulator